MILSVGSNQCCVKTKLLSFLLFTKTISIKKKKSLHNEILSSWIGFSDLTVKKKRKNQPRPLEPSRPMSCCNTSLSLRQPLEKRLIVCGGSVPVNKRSFVKRRTGLRSRGGCGCTYSLSAPSFNLSRLCFCPQPKKKVTLYLLYCVATAVIGSLQFGYNTGVINAPEQVRLCLLFVCAGTSRKWEAGDQ